MRRKSFPQFVPERLKEARLGRGVTASELASVLGVSQQAISQYEKGITMPSSMILNRITGILNFPLSYFTQPITEESQKSVTFFRSRTAATKKSKNMQSIKLEWIESIYKYLNNYLDFPKVNVPFNSSKKAFYSLEEIDDIAVRIRKEWGLGLGPISNVVLLLEKKGIIVSRATLDDIKIDACSLWINQRPYILLGNDKNSSARSRFDAAHELGHLVLHQWVTPEDFLNKETFDRIEKEANRFASAFLMPRESFAQEIISTSLDFFVTLKERWKTSIAAMIYRADDLGIITKYQALHLRKKMSKLKIVAKEPLDDVLEIEQPTLYKQAISFLIDNQVTTKQNILEDLPFVESEIEEMCNLPTGFFRPNNVLEFKIKK